MAGGILHGRHDGVVAPRKVREGELERRGRARRVPDAGVRRVLWGFCHYRRGRLEGLQARGVVELGKYTSARTPPQY